MFIVIRSCLMYSVMVIQSYIIYTDKIHKKLNNGLNQKVNEQDSQHLLQVSYSIYAHYSSINRT